MNDDDINKLIRTFIRVTLAMPVDSVRPANKTAPTGKQTDQFATVLITMLEPTGQDDVKHSNDAAPALTVSEEITGMRHMVVSVQFFRGDAYTKACRLRTLMSNSLVAANLQAIGLGFIKASPARNLTAVVDAAWEARGQIELELYLIAREVQIINTFGSFPISINTESSSTNSEVTAP